MPEVIKTSLNGPWCGFECDSGALNALDRTVVGNNSLASCKISDAFVITNLAFPHIAGFIDVMVSKPSDGFVGYGKDTLVLLEALAINSLINQIFKYAVRRPRPYVYDNSVDAKKRTEPDAALSFYSEHTSASFTMATAYSYTFMKRHPRSPWVIPMWIGTHVMAASTGVLRVTGGKHFWTDVLTGAAIGSSIGFRRWWWSFADA